MKFLLTIFLMMALAACSGSKVANDAEDAAGEAETELAEGVEDALDDEEDALGDEEDELEDVALEDEEEEAEEDGEFEEEEVSVSDEEPSEERAEVVEETGTLQEDISPEQMVESSPAPSMDMSGDQGWYSVQSGDTLMIIAFKVYGDYDKWRSLARWNSARLGPNHSISVGMKLKYDMPAQKFEWNPSGNPYIIRSGDTLGTISRDTYGTMDYWRDIWRNNEPLIKNPDRIFAGFTIYTPVISGRDVANQDL